MTSKEYVVVVIVGGGGGGGDDVMLRVPRICNCNADCITSRML